MQDKPKSYPLPFETIPCLKLSDHIEDLVEFQSYLEGRGIQTTNTRIERYVEYLKQATVENSADGTMIFKNSAEGPFESSTDWMLYVLREAHELMWILKGLKVRVPLGIDERLRVIVGGRDFAALDTDSKSRNAQFELRIASYFCQAGCDVDLSTETDVIAKTDDQMFYLECKRVGSKSQLAKRLSEAKQQLYRRMPKNIGKRVVFGCVAVDVTKVAFSHNGLTFAMTNEHSKDIVQEKLIEIANISQRSSLFRDCRNVFSYWFQAHIPSLILHPPTTVTRFSSYHILRDSMSRKEHRAVRAFCNIFESASKGDTREAPAKALTPRTNYTFPKGTTFNLDEGLLMEFLETGKVTEKGINEEVATLTINDRSYTFSFFDFRMILPGITKETLNKFLHDL